MNGTATPPPYAFIGWTGIIKDEGNKEDDEEDFIMFCIPYQIW
jgi:hypothetical protein